MKSTGIGCNSQSKRFSGFLDLNPTVLVYQTGPIPKPWRTRFRDIRGFFRWVSCISPLKVLEFRKKLPGGVEESLG